jgi:hypothetical protein
MRKLITLGLVAILGGLPVHAAGPVERAISREAARLARDTDGPDASSWRQLRGLAPGTPITVMTEGGSVSGRFVSFDEKTVMVSRNGVVEHFGVDDINMVQRRVRRGSALTAALAATLGLWAGAGIATNLAFEQCQPNCGGVQAGMFAAAIGIPIAAGCGAWRASSHLVDEVVYQRIR